MYFRINLFFLTGVCFFFGGNSFSQSFSLNPGCGIAKEIVIDASGVQAVSKSKNDSLFSILQTNSVLYLDDGTSPSTWFKIFVNNDCQISLNIYPSQKENRYNFFLYKQTQNISICEIKDTRIVPFRANLFQDEMFETGTGLSPSSTVTFYDTTSKSMEKDFYHTAYHSAVNAKTGEVYFLNIYHINGNDCGYHFTLSSGKASQNFEFLLPPCFNDKIKTQKVKQYVNPYPLRYISDVSKPAVNEVPVPMPPAKIIIAEIPKATFLVRDSLKHELIEAEIKRVGKINSPASKENMTDKGKYEMLLDNHSGYHLVFSSLGYKDADVVFVTQENARSFTNDVYLSPCRTGENFTMNKMYFYPNSYKMKPEAKGELNRLLAYMKNNPGTSIEIQGHTNGNKRIKASYDSGFKGSSKKLSQYRAEVIKKFLTDNGIAEERLAPVGYGGSKMIYPDPQNQAQANKNIRVEVLILSQKESALSSKTIR